MAQGAQGAQGAPASHFFTKLYAKCPFSAYIVLSVAREGATECMCLPNF